MTASPRRWAFREVDALGTALKSFGTARPFSVSRRLRLYARGVRRVAGEWPWCPISPIR
jgi:hypothetical protein